MGKKQPLYPHIPKSAHKTESLESMFTKLIQDEVEAADLYEYYAGIAENLAEPVTAELFRKIARDERHHYDWLQDRKAILMNIGRM